MRRNAARLGVLLDTMFGFFVWAAHFLAVYITTAVSCQLGLGAARAAVRTSFLTGLVLITVVAAAIVVLHAVRRYRQSRDASDKRFRLSMTIGCDAMAALAITWQLFAILMMPPCA